MYFMEQFCTYSTLLLVLDFTSGPCLKKMLRHQKFELLKYCKFYFVKGCAARPTCSRAEVNSTTLIYFIMYYQVQTFRLVSLHGD